jgi:hypothetical protein
MSLALGGNQQTDRFMKAWTAFWAADDAFMDAVQTGRRIPEMVAARQVALAEFTAARAAIEE